MKRKGSRKLSIFQYLEVLQQEYYLAYLRYRIYPSVKDREYYKRTMEGKLEKIKSISSEHNLPNIVSDEVIDESVRLKVLGTGGFPEITYRNKEDRDAFEFTDKVNYYLKGSDVAICSEETDEVQHGVVESFDLVTDEVSVKIYPTSVIVKANIKFVSRVF